MLRRGSTIIHDELRPEYDLGKLRVRRLGPGRKRFGRFVAPDLDSVSLDLESLYKYVEELALADRRFDQAQALLKKFRDANQETNPAEAEKAQWEIYFLWFVLKEGELGPQWREADEHGQVCAYPDLSQFTESTYEYLASRLDATDHPKLKARYAHILWCSPKEHHRFAEIAIASYLKLISIYEQRHDEGEDFSQDISESAINAYSVVRQIKGDVAEIKSEFKRLVRKLSAGTPFAAFHIIQFMLKPKMRFSKKDFDGLEDLCWQMAESFGDDQHSAIKFLELGKTVAQKLNQQPDNWVHNWTREIAQHYEALMQRSENDPYGALFFCMNAIENYKGIRNEQKVKELARQYSELKAAMKFGRSRLELDLTEIEKRCQAQAKAVVKNRTSEEVVRYLILDKELLPTCHEVKEAVQERIREFPTRRLLSKVVLDWNGNTVQRFESAEEKEHYDILERYKYQLEFRSIYLIRAVFFEAISEKKLTFEGLIDFIERQCWYGTDLPKRLPDGQTVMYNWLDLIRPALNAYFRQMDFYFTDRTANAPDFVLCLDSLTLKIEGLFRDLCQRSDIITSVRKHKKDINALLHADAIKELFDEDDLLFFKFLLIERCGYNLSHNIAHALMSVQEYSFDYMHLVILALLRLGKCDLPGNNDESSTE